MNRKNAEHEIENILKNVISRLRSGKAVGGEIG